MTAVKTLSESNFHQVTTKYCPHLNENRQLLLSSSFCLLTYVASVDRNICAKEISYLKYFLKTEFELEQITYRELTKSYIFIFGKEQPSKDEIAACKTYLKENMSEQDKSLFLNTLLCLSSADDNMDQTEKNFVKNIGMALDMDKQDVMESILSKNLELVQQIDHDIAQNNDLVSDVSELNEITFASAHEFMQSLK